MAGIKDLEERVTLLEEEVARLREWIKEAMKWKKVLDPLPIEPGDLS